ncbi:MAG: tRNA (N6-isopentenyl adenosine(37)-C2)-methylthiotransferase MiaB [Verrucomicrobia bacterium]|nr:MAG: tRNA (N6-isopentenyl adenosine(37)-C2)-methylthiotransferase MiaB [Verrucomicrobiota bacterium]
MGVACLTFTALQAMPSVYVKTYGCQMNERDSEAVAAQLVAKGYTLAPSEHVADVILLNTCSVRDMAEQKALNKMENLAADIRRSRPKVVLGFMGCMAQSRGQELIDRLPDVDLVVGTQKFHRTADYLDEILAGRRHKVVDVAEEKGSEATIKEHLLYGNGDANGGHRPPLQVTAFVSIMQGCNQYCTFCIVPYTRGVERSRTIPDIVAECRELVTRGAKEITLLGQIVTSYGRRRSPLPALSPSEGERFARKISRIEPLNSSSRREEALSEVRNPKSEIRNSESLLTSAATRFMESVEQPGEGCIPIKNDKSAFVQLLEAVNAIDGLERIRFTSPHPKGYGDDLVEAYARLPKLCESAHLPVQSGSNRILKLMHRGYSRERYLGIIEKLRRVKPEMGITTDMIVGFPGETEADFAETLSLVREVEFDNAFVFKYSPRKDTPAAVMPNPVPQEVIEERHGRLLDLVNEIGKRKYRRCVGRRAQILVEGPSRKNPARLEGRTRTNKIVVFEGSERHLGQLLDLNIAGAGGFTLYGDPAIVNLD